MEMAMRFVITAILCMITCGLCGCGGKQIFSTHYSLANGTETSARFYGNKVDAMDEGDTAVFFKVKGEDDYYRTGVKPLILNVGRSVDVNSDEFNALPKRPGLHVENFIVGDGPAEGNFLFRMYPVEIESDDLNDTKEVNFLIAIKNIGTIPVRQVLVANALPVVSKVEDVEVMWINRSPFQAPFEMTNFCEASQHLNCATMLYDIFFFNLFTKNSGFDKLTYDVKKVDDQLYLLARLEMTKEPLLPGQSVILKVESEIEIEKVVGRSLTE